MVGTTVVVFHEICELVNPDRNLKSGTIAPQKKSGTTVLEKAGL